MKPEKKAVAMSDEEKAVFAVSASRALRANNFKCNIVSHLYFV